MSLDLFNNIINNLKENDFVQNFLNELNESFNNANLSGTKTNDILKQENVLYQVVDMCSDGAYLQNTENNRVSKETSIDKDVLEQIGNDSILCFKDGAYHYERELTRQVL